MSAHAHSLPALFRLVMRGALCVYVAFIIWQSLIPAGTGGAVPHMDKLLHGIVYALLAGGACIAWPKLSKKTILIGCVALGAALEVAQGTMTLGRTASIWDGLANSLGAALGIFLVVLFTRKFIRQ